MKSNLSDFFCIYLKFIIMPLSSMVLSPYEESVIT